MKYQPKYALDFPMYFSHRKLNQIWNILVPNMVNNKAMHKCVQLHDELLSIIMLLKSNVPTRYDLPSRSCNMVTIASAKLI